MRQPSPQQIAEAQTAFEALEKHGTQTAAAEALGVSRETLQRRIRLHNRLRAQRGDAPDHGLTHELPEGLVLKGTSIRYNAIGEIEQYWNKSRLEGSPIEETVQLHDPKKIVKVSTLYDQQGKVTQQWVAEKPEDAQREALWRAFAKELASELPRAEPLPPPTFANDDLLAAYPVGDHHFGQLSWGEEVGESYDLKIAEALLEQSVGYLVCAVPPCKQALIAVLGDFMHYDSFEALTPTSGHLLDADSRYPKMVRTAIRSLRHMISVALARHQNVHVIIEIGNHDLSSSIFLMECLANIYEKEPRVTVDTHPGHYHYYRFGQCLIGTHHGHGVKMERLPLIMASDRSEDWGETKFRYWWTGHIHHSKTKSVAEQSQDFTGCSVESFRVLAPTDAWAAQKGYRAQRDMKALILHREFGEVARHTVNPSMFPETEAA